MSDVRCQMLDVKSLLEKEFRRLGDNMDVKKKNPFKMRPSCTQDPQIDDHPGPKSWKGIPEQPKDAKSDPSRPQMMPKFEPNVNFWIWGASRPPPKRPRASPEHGQTVPKSILRHSRDALAPPKRHVESVHYIQHLGGVGLDPYTIRDTSERCSKVIYIVYGSHLTAQMYRV